MVYISFCLKLASIIAYISLDELGKVYVPNLKRDGEGEQLSASFVNLRCGQRVWSVIHACIPYLEAFLVVLILFEEGGVVDYDLRVCYTQF